MRTWPTRRERRARIEIIPMIDVMMFLLVFFVLISINVLPALGLKITPPTSGQSQQVTEKLRIMVGIDRDGQTYIDGQPTALADITDRLKGMAAASTKPLSVVIAGDEASVLQNLIGVLDALKQAGVGAAQIVTRPK